MKILLNFQSDLPGLRFLMMSFTLKYFKNDFLGLFLLLSHKNVVSCDFHVFCFVLNICDFSVFLYCENLPLFLGKFRLYREISVNTSLCYDYACCLHTYWQSAMLLWKTSVSRHLVMKFKYTTTVPPYIFISEIDKLFLTACVAFLAQSGSQTTSLAWKYIKVCGYSDRFC